MTDQVQNFSAEQSQPASSESVNVASSAPVQQERMLPQSEVNKIVGKIRDESYQKGVQEALNRHQQQHAEPVYQQQQPMMQQAPQHTQYVGGIPQQSPEQIRAMIAEEQQKLDNFRNYQGTVNSFISKVEAGKTKFEDFDNVAKDLNLPQMPVIWQTAEKFDNPADIVYHLGKNPGKLAQLLTMAQVSPEMVKRGMQEISDSLKQNEVAAEQKQPNAPLGRPKPSNIGMGNGDKNLSVQDYKKIYRT
jgi:hypothetical protein